MAAFSGSSQKTTTNRSSRVVLQKWVLLLNPWKMVFSRDLLLSRQPLWRHVSIGTKKSHTSCLVADLFERKLVDWKNCSIDGKRTQQRNAQTTKHLSDTVLGNNFRSNLVHGQL